MNDAVDPEIVKMQREDAHRQHDRHFDATLKAFDTVIGFSVPAMRAPGIINAGAFASILAYLSQMDDGLRSDAKILAGFLIYFIAGVLFSSASHGTAYFTQIFYQFSSMSYGYNYQHPFVRPGKYTRRYNVVGIIFQCITILLVCLSYVVFCIGSYQSYLELVSIYSK